MEVTNRTKNISKSTVLKELPIENFLKEAIPFVGRVASWDAKTDSLIFYENLIGKLRERFESETVNSLIVAHENLHRMRFKTSALIDYFLLNNLNCHLITKLDKYTKIFHPIKLKEQFLTHAIAANRLLIESIPILEAITMFELRHSPHLLKRDRLIFSEILLSLEKAFWVSNKRAERFYHKILKIYDLTENSEIPSWIVDMALNYPHLKHPFIYDNSSMLQPGDMISGVPPCISPIERFLTLFDTVQALVDKRTFKEIVKAIPDPWSKPIGHFYKKLDFYRYFYKNLVIQVQPIAISSFRHRIYQIMMKKLIEREKIAIEKQKIVSGIHESSALRIIVNALKKDKWIILMQFREDLSNEERWELCHHFALSCFAHQILQKVDQINCVYRMLNICKEECSKCFLGKLEQNLNKHLNSFLDVETSLDFIYFKTKKELHSLVKESISP